MTTSRHSVSRARRHHARSSAPDAAAVSGDGLRHHGLYRRAMGTSDRASVRAAANQVPPLVGHNVVAADLALSEAVVRHGSAEVLEGLLPLGAEAGTAEAREQGRLANEHHPELTAYDRYGNRIDEVEFHPAWHWLMERAVGHGLAATPWERQADGDPDAHLRRAAGFLAWSHTEPGHGCPISMTYAAIPALRVDDALAKEWTPLLASTTYDPGLRPVSEKRGALCGMGMTEKQGGSDVRANVTEARPQPDGSYTLHGHKWFTSAPMNDVFLVLAQAAGRRDLLRGAAGAAGRHPQPARRRTPQGQARQPLQRLVRARVRRHRRAAARRRGPRGADHHRDGRRHPARLRARLGRADAAGGVRGVVARRPPLGVRLAAGRQAADAERRRRPRRRVRGRHGGGAAARLGRRRPGRPARGRAAADRAAAGEVLGLQAHARRSPPRRWSASAATGTSRSR